MIIIAAVLGGILYRLRGAGVWPSRPWWHIAFAAAYGASTFLDFGIIGVLIVTGITTGALLTGHASYMDLGNVPDGSTSSPSDGDVDEWYGAWIPGSGYWHEFAGLAISGMLVSASAGIALILAGQIESGLAIIASGSLKAPAYSLAWIAYRKAPHLDPIAIAECLAGVLLWGSLAMIVLCT